MPAGESHQARLERAEAHIFAMGLPDSGTRLCVANMRYGLAKIHHVQQTLGLPPNATFIGTPDMTITRNAGRWAAGFGYGGRVSWGNGQDEFLVLDVKANACGMLVGAAERLPSMAELIGRVDAIKQDEVMIEDVRVAWDFGRGNHFIDIFEVEAADPELGLPAYVFALHASGAEHRAATAWGPGLYWDESPDLAAQAEVFETPFGPLHLLRGQAALRFFGYYQHVERFACRRRVIAAERLFGEFALLCNESHQGYCSQTEIVLGCHDTMPPRLLPVMLRADLPGYLVRGRANLSDDTIAARGFTQRAAELGVLGRLRRANVAPHGGGYTLPELRDVAGVIEVGDRRYFECTTTGGAARKVLADLRGVPYGYRGRSVLLESVQLGLCDIVATLRPVQVLKV